MHVLRPQFRIEHKSDEDHVAVANHLAREDDTGSRRLAEKMRALRPGLGYEQ